MLKNRAAVAAALAFLLMPVAAAQDVPLPRERPAGEAASGPEVPPVPRPRPEPQTEAPPSATGAPAAEATPDAPGDASPLPGTPDGTTPEITTPPETPPETTEPSEPSAPPRVYQTACPAVLNGDVVATALPPISDNLCGLQSPLSLEAVSANGRTIPFNTAITTDCGMASALPGWIGDVDRFVRATEDTRIATVNVGTGYMCRNVNNGKTGNLSFHAFGDAVDVIGFTLEDGRTIDVTTAWPGTVPEGSKLIRFAHDAACTRFTTVLGPEANAEHHDHLHLDLGCHGKTCTARLCE